MVLFFAQINNPNEQDKKMFEKIKKKIAITFKKMKKANKKDLLICKTGQNWIAIHQFLCQT